MKLRREAAVLVGSMVVSFVLPHVQGERRRQKDARKKF
jgi:hypothetical protein